jgi:putative flavoprotein involved in K+ transport
MTISVTAARSPFAASHYDAVVVGAGQAGLSMSHVLKQAGIHHVVLEKHRIAHAWRSERWDSFCLVTPNWQCQLPGHPYVGSDPEGFMLKHEIVDYLERYAEAFEPPVLEGVSVVRVAYDAARRGTAPPFEIQTSAGAVTADHVIVATGGYHDPFVPEASGRFPSSIAQLHSRDYSNPDSLPEGEVLVVGTGQSGCQIAEDLLLAGRKVHLSVGNAPRCARRYRGKDVVEWLNLMGHYELPVDEHPSKRHVRDKTNHYVTGRDGGRDIDLRDFALRGVSLYGTFEDAIGTRLRFAPDLARNLDAADAVYESINRSIDAYIEQRGLAAPPPTRYVAPWAPAREDTELDLTATRITSVVWAIGFRTNFSFIDAPIFDAKGLPEHERGVTPVPGLYFLGLPWQYTWGSGRLCGVGRDAAHLGRRIAEAVQREAVQREAAGRHTPQTSGAAVG